MSCLHRLEKVTLLFFLPFVGRDPKAELLPSFLQGLLQQFVEGHAGSVEGHLSRGEGLLLGRVFGLKKRRQLD